MDFENSNVADFTNISDHVTFYEKGYFVFGLYQIRPDGTCGCEYPDCKNIGKHPIRSGWQHPIKWDKEQWIGGHMAGQFKTGYGVLMKGLLVVDVDAKNGGVTSFKRLMEDLPELAECGFVVDTGSGGGSQHWYFKYDGSSALRQAHEKYPGIDFKSTGYVVGPGSLHKSGNKYAVSSGNVEEITDAPGALLTLLEKTGTYRVSDDDKQVDVSEDELQKMVDCISSELQYEEWIQVGMAINDALNGEGYELWNSLSKRVSREGVAYDEATTHYKWKSFTPGGGVGFPTLKYWAIQGGWREEVTFTSTMEELTTVTIDEDIDLDKPPGFVGDVCDWINDQCAKPRHALSAMAALTAIGNIGALRYEDDMPRKASSNLFSVCVAGSGTGKGAILEATNTIHQIAGLLSVTYGKSKSSQELYRNLIDKQLALFNIDELGIKFTSIANASKSGTAYLETWFGEMMSLYSASNSIVNVSGDEVRDIIQTLQAKIAAVKKAIEDNEMEKAKGHRLIEEMSEKIKNPAIIRPFVSLIGYSTPETMVPVITPERVREGFLGRTLIAWEPVDLPRDKKGFAPRRMSKSMETSLRSLIATGDSELEPWEEGTRTRISTTPEARVYIDSLNDYFFDLSMQYRESNGMHAVPTRGLEQVLKISYILALPGRQRTLEHVKWALAFVNRDMKQKIQMAVGNSDSDDALINKLLSVLSKDDPLTEGVVKMKVGRRKDVTSGDIANALESLVQSGLAVRSEVPHKGNGKIFVYYQLK